jgi:hypothetical protein
MASRTFAVALAVLTLAFAPGDVASQDAAPDRSGFTMLLSLGVGRQDDGALPEAKTALAGLNLGLGGFLTSDLALWFRASGTTAQYDEFGFNQTSGFGGPVLQYWVTDKVNLEGGVGAGFWTIEDENDAGLGIMLGAGFVFFNSGRHNLQVGLEYAGAFVDPETIHNVGINFGWQLL